jgi:hypothetical protein
VHHDSETGMRDRKRRRQASRATTAAEASMQRIGMTLLSVMKGPM